MKQITYKKLLVTHDGSDLALAVLPHVVALAKVYKSDVILLQVVVPTLVETDAFYPMGSIPSSPVAYEQAQKETAEHMEIAQKQLDRMKSDLLKEGIRSVETFVQKGDPADIIVSFGKSKDIDCIIMATHGRSGFKRLLLGSVAEQVVRHTSLPVLLIHPTD